MHCIVYISSSRRCCMVTRIVIASKRLCCMTLKKCRMSFPLSI
ncbi:hypothetical protein [Rickettsia endosymbiont of Orchestes rusci]